MYIAVVNLSTRVTDDDAQKMTAAVQQQVMKDYCPAWGLSPITVAFHDESNPPPGEADVIGLVDSAPEAPDALGYHSEDGNDVIFGKIEVNPVLDNGGSVLSTPGAIESITVSSVLSHEVLEMIGDPNVNDWCDGPQIQQGSSYAKEVADPVEGDSYAVTLADGTEVAVSNFVLPAYFDPQNNVGPFDELGMLTAPFTMDPGGYFVVRSTPDDVQQVFGEKYPEWKKAWKKAAHHRTAKRTAKKGS